MDIAEISVHAHSSIKNRFDSIVVAIKRGELFMTNPKIRGKS